MEESHFDPDYDTYTFPIQGIIFSIRKDRVKTRYILTRYCGNGPDQKLMLEISATSEQEADAMAEQNGEIENKKHWHEILAIDENTLLKKITEKEVKDEG